GHVEVLKILKAAGTSMRRRDPHGCSALHRSAEAGHVEAVKFFIDEFTNFDGTTPKP
ncbi:unnamed protein product, partial [Heterosigma akashiwo]